VAGPLICEACGARVPSGRGRCGRCGAPFAAPPSAESETQPASRTLLAVAGGCAVVGVVLLAMFGGLGQGVSATVTAPVTSAPPAPLQQPSGAPSAPLTPAASFAAADATRSGSVAYQEGDLASAEERYTTAVAADPGNADALNNLGQVLVRTGRAREALPYFDHAIAIAGDVWAYRFNRARAHGELEEWRDAVTGYTEAARLFPDDYVTQFNLARAQQASGDLTGAIETYARAIDLAPAQADFHLWYGQALDQAARLDEAAAEYSRFLELQPGAPQAEKVQARLAQLGRS
jgi:tetratricopeptide (TPR) repeat protein